LLPISHSINHLLLPLKDDKNGILERLLCARDVDHYVPSSSIEDIDTSVLR